MACLKRGKKFTFFKCWTANCKPVRSDKVHRVEPTLYSLVCFQQAGTTQPVPAVFTQLALPQPVCIDSVAFMSIVHTFFWLITPTDAFRDIDYFLCSPPIFLSLFLSHVLAFTLSVKMFCMLMLPFKLCEKGHLARERGNCPFCTFICSLLFRRPTPEVWSQLGVWMQELTTFLWGAGGGLWGGGWGQTGRGSSCPVTWVQTLSPVLLAAHIPQ